MSNPVPLPIRLGRAAWGDDLTTMSGAVHFAADFIAGSAGFTLGFLMSGSPVGGLAMATVAPSVVENVALHLTGRDRQVINEIDAKVANSVFYNPYLAIGDVLVRELIANRKYLSPKVCKRIDQKCGKSSSHPSGHIPIG